LPKEDKLDLVFKSNAVDASVLHALIDLLADAAGICAKLVDEAGEVVAVNEALADAPELINSEPYGEGWIMQVRLADANALDDLLDAEGYANAIADE